MSYRVSFRASADKAIQARMVEKAMALGVNPRPTASVKLAGASGLWRIRVGDYRMAYLIDDERRTVDIRIVAHRREIYRGL